MALSIVPLQLRDVWLALPAQTVQEILGQRPWVVIAGAPSELPGVIAWRGRAIALLDLGALVGGARPLGTGESRRRTLIVQLDGATLAIPVDGVREVQQIPDDSVRRAQATRQRFADHEVELDGIPLPLIDLDQLVASLALAPAAPA
jgi:chemotaxis signal transduction protein